jgi:hypothetical protein
MRQHIGDLSCDAFAQPAGADIMCNNDIVGDNECGCEVIKES